MRLRRRSRLRTGRSRPSFTRLRPSVTCAPPTKRHWPIGTGFTGLVHRGTFIVHVAFAKRMAARGGGSIVTLSSWNGVRSARMHAYCTAKAAVNLLTESMAAEWGRSGVRFNTVSPGVVMTERVAERIASGTRYTIPPPELTALGRLVTAREVAEAAVFLISDKASGISGANLAVDAGTLVTQAWGMFGGVPKARSAPAITCAARDPPKHLRRSASRAFAGSCPFPENAYPGPTRERPMRQIRRPNTRMSWIRDLRIAVGENNRHGRS